MKNNEQLTYKQAIQELENIVQDLERDNQDIDTLCQRLMHATELEDFCRNRLTEESNKVKQTLEE